jgi:hypothetical protein
MSLLTSGLFAGNGSGSTKQTLALRCLSFRDLSQQAILLGGSGSVRQLVDAIVQYLAQHNLNPKRYVSRAKGEEFLAKIQRACKAALGER